MPPIGSSDHLPVVAKYQSIITKSKPATSSEYTKWLFPLKDVRKMDDAFLYENWEHVFQPYNDIDETWTRWKLAFLKDLELFIPKSTRKSHNRTPSAPWFSKELKQLIRRKNRLFKKAHASGNSDHWKAYCLERNKTTAAIKRAKSVHFHNQVNTLSDPNCSPSRWWQVARDLCGLKRGVSSCVPPLLDSCGNVISEPVEKANLLNDVFANENTSLNPDASVFGPTNLQLTFNLEKITASEVRRVLRTLPNKSSCGSDRISYQMIKEAGPGLVGPLVSLFNASLRLRKVPDEWRKSTIKPIFKGGRKDRRDPSSYRPIALTSCVARTMEKVLNARILEYLQKNSLLYEHQSGFQRNHSTISQLCFLAHQWTTALDGGKNVQSVFLDLSKAYDRVSIPGLLRKLSLIGFSSSATEWFASFLTHREQCVLLDGTTSAPLTPKSGIPQGTVLGPVLFLIFINDLPESTQSQCSIFADDTTLHTADKSSISSCARLSSDLDTAASWAERWGMLFSAPKSKHLAIGRTAKQSPLVRMNGVPIPQVRTHKHLGLIFNNTLTWNDHVSNVYSTCVRMLGILRRLDGNISPLCMERIYKTAIRSRMEYACAVWSGGSTRSLQRLQDSFAKRLGLTLPPLKNRFNYHTLVLFYKIRQNLAPKYLCTLVPDLSSTTSGYSFRKFSYPVPLTKKSATLESFLPRAIILWNDLPTNVQSSKTLSTFKTKLRVHLSL